MITFVADAGPAWWQRSVRTFSGVSLAVLLLYACWRSTEYATGQFATTGSSPSLELSWFYPVVSMTVGWYFITLHYLAAVTAGAARLAEEGRRGVRQALGALAGAVVIGAVVWGLAAVLLAVGASWIVALGVIFVALTLAGTPIIFMLLIVGIIAFLPSFLGLEFFPSPNPLVPFSTTQSVMGLTSGPELIVILMFLVTAEVLNASGMSARLISFAAAVVGHFRGGMAYVCQLTSLVVSGISGSAQADAAIMTPLLVPAMEREGYRRDVAAAVVAGASIKGPIGPLSIMFIVYGVLVTGPASASIQKLLLSGVFAVILLFLFQAATVYVVVRRLGFLKKRRFGGWATVGRTGLSALPVLAIPFIILGGYFSGVFTLYESGSVAAVVAIAMAMFGYASLAPRQLPGVLVLAAIETGIVMLLLGDSAILAKALFLDRFGESLEELLHRHHGQQVRLPAGGEPDPAGGGDLPRAAAGALHPGALHRPGGGGRVRHRPGPVRPDHGLQPGARPDPPADRAGALPGLEHRQGLGGAIVDHDPALAGGEPGRPLPGHLPAERGGALVRQQVRLRRAAVLTAALASAPAFAGCQDSGARVETGGGESVIVLRPGVVGGRSDPAGCSPPPSPPRSLRAQAARSRSARAAGPRRRPGYPRAHARRDDAAGARAHPRAVAARMTPRDDPRGRSTASLQSVCYGEARAEHARRRRSGEKFREC